MKVPVGGMPDLPPELDRRAERENQVPVVPADLADRTAEHAQRDLGGIEREVQGLPPVEPEPDWDSLAAGVAEFVRNHIKDKFKMFPPEHHAALLLKVRRVINQLNKERKAALDLIAEETQ
jgi:hypothetical protein